MGTIILSLGLVRKIGVFVSVFECCMLHVLFTISVLFVDGIAIRGEVLLHHVRNFNI